jgi:threonine dehydrogenase-like Zn-dependent dehydrogenase
MRTVCFEKNIPKGLLVKALRPVWPNVVFTPLSLTRLVDVPEPPLPGPRWVRVRNWLSGICATDLHMLSVEADPRASPAALPSSERVYLGHEVVGQVSEVGSGVTSLKVGDRVIMDHEAPNCISQGIEPPCRHCQQANYLLCENASLGQGPCGVGGGWGDGFTAHEAGAYHVPDDLDDEAAVLIEPLSVAVRAALRRLPRADEQALVVGCGIIGLAVIQAVRALSPGCRVTAMARHPQQVQMAHQLGADRVLAGEDPYEATARITGGKLYDGMLGNRAILGGFDVVYDCVGSARTLQDSLRWARAGGTVVLTGAHLELMHLDLTPVWYQEVNLVGTLGHGREEWNGGELSTYDLTAELLRQGKLTAEGLITHRFPLERWPEAVRAAADKRSGAIKVVLDCRL